MGQSLYKDKGPLFSFQAEKGTFCKDLIGFLLILFDNLFFMSISNEAVLWLGNDLLLIVCYFFLLEIP